MDSVEAPTEAAFMRTVAQALLASSQIDRPPYTGMYISLTGTLSLAARALRELAEAPDTDAADALADHETRCYDSQPALRAFALEELGKHLVMLKAAIETGDSGVVRRFFEVYRFD